MSQSNPLAKHFRQPAIFLKLPSKGAYWPKDSLELGVTGELPVYPMTTKDEITLRTPDALINGSGVVSVIQSCIPAILDPWAMPSVDIDACLISIRIASYGNDMNVSTPCPKCKHIDDHTIELTSTLDHIEMPNFDNVIVYKDLKIKLKPQTYFAVNRANSIRFKEQRILDLLATTDISAEDREANIKQITNEMVELNFESLAGSTEYILMSDGTRVTEQEFINEFYANTGSALIRVIQTSLVEIADSAGIKPYNNECTECGHHYKSSLEFDYANFFGIGS